MSSASIDPTKHVDTSLHKTQKSFKSDRRDKPKHSGKLTGGPKKGGGGGKGTWGRAGDEAKSMNEDPNDPNYSEPELDNAEGGGGGGGSNDWNNWDISESATIKFASSLEDFAKFKSSVKNAAKEFLQSNDANEFNRLIKALGMTVFHQDLPYILIKWSLDLTDDERNRISSLLHSLNKAGFVTPSQMGAGMRKLYNSLADLTVDCPHARTYLREYLQFASAGGFLDASLASNLEEEQNKLSETEKVNELKTKIKKIVTEFWESEDLPDAVKSLSELNAPHLAFETVKQLLSQSIDRSHRQREGASVFFADQIGRYFTSSDVEKGFTIMLERVDDLALDVPSILKYMSVFVARAIVDEVLPPAFLVRVDLNQADLGGRVLNQAQEFLKQENASDRLQDAWLDMEYQEDEQKKKLAAAQ